MKNILKNFHRYKGGIAMIALVALLAVLKLMWFDYSWWWVFAPAIAPLIASIIIFVVVFTIEILKVRR